MEEQYTLEEWMGMMEEAEAVVIQPTDTLRAAIERYRRSQESNTPPNRQARVMSAVRPKEPDQEEMEEGRLSRLAAGAGLAAAALMGGAKDAKAQAAPTSGKPAITQAAPDSAAQVTNFKNLAGQRWNAQNRGGQQGVATGTDSTEFVNQMGDRKAQQIGKDNAAANAELERMQAAAGRFRDAVRQGREQGKTVQQIGADAAERERQAFIDANFPGVRRNTPPSTGKPPMEEQYTLEEWMSMLEEAGYSLEEGTLDELSPELLQRASDKRMAQADAAIDAANKGHFQDKADMMKVADKLRDKQNKLYQASTAAASRDRAAKVAADKETAVQNIGLSPAMRKQVGLGQAPTAPATGTKPSSLPLPGRTTAPTAPTAGTKPSSLPLPGRTTAPTAPTAGTKPSLPPLPPQKKSTIPPVPPVPPRKGPPLPGRVTAESYTLEEWMGMLEEAGYSLNELSPETLASYNAKATKDLETHNDIMKRDSSNFERKAKNRHKGIQAARGVLRAQGMPTEPKNEGQLEEKGDVAKQNRAAKDAWQERVGMANPDAPTQPHKGTPHTKGAKEIARSQGRGVLKKMEESTISENTVARLQGLAGIKPLNS